MLDADGHSIFGALDNRVVRAPAYGLESRAQDRHSSSERKSCTISTLPDLTIAATLVTAHTDPLGIWPASSRPRCRRSPSRRGRRTPPTTCCAAPTIRSKTRAPIGRSYLQPMPHEADVETLAQALFGASLPANRRELRSRLDQRAAPALLRSSSPRMVLGRHFAVTMHQHAQRLPRLDIEDERHHDAMFVDAEALGRSARAAPRLPGVQMRREFRATLAQHADRGEVPPDLVAGVPVRYLRRDRAPRTLVIDAGAPGSSPTPRDRHA